MRKAAAAVALAAVPVAIGLFLGLRAPDPGPAREKRQLADRIRSDLENQRDELTEEERKFKAETDKLDSQARELAVARAGLERQVDAALGVRYSYESGLTILRELETALAAEIASMQSRAAELTAARDAIAARIDSLEREKESAPPARAAELAMEIEKKRNEMSTAGVGVAAALSDIAVASSALSGR